MSQGKNAVKTTKWTTLLRRLVPGCDLWIVPNILDFLSFQAWARLR